MGRHFSSYIQLKLYIEHHKVFTIKKQENTKYLDKNNFHAKNGICSGIALTVMNSCMQYVCK